ncbi:Iqg1p [Sugiyamaella lignohabitans]|uniref:Iqg1p n=1 Tax=Sugiyamaella lignohabitans TaxID=796027 RepID=A0A167FYX6_9ASCO|nr:Iqg1p [Sugiyamaella lignohabitans]ANB15883.1 Iqg1p [Sugiyamaella lignohabitans]
MPELFTFELTDLYDKKNIPKVIYCIHALSFILSAENLAPAIGNLVGKLEFTDDELYHTQKGLDASGVNLPNFAGMNRHFEQQQPPQLSEEEQMAVDFQKCEGDIILLQALCRGALGRKYQHLLKSCVHDIVQLQAAGRGSLFRYEHNADRYILERSEDKIASLQSCVRASNVRRRLAQQQNQQLKHHILWSKLQAGARGALLRADLREMQYDLKFLALPDILALQSVIRGTNLRRRLSQISESFTTKSQSVSLIQAKIRGNLLRSKKEGLRQVLESEVDSVIGFQSLIRALPIQRTTRERLSNLRSNGTTNDIKVLQSVIRARKVRQQLNQDETILEKESDIIVGLQSLIRSAKVRGKFEAQKCHIYDSEVVIARLQSVIRGDLVRKKVDFVKSQTLKCMSEIIELQSIARGSLLRSKVCHIRNILNEEETSVLSLQSIARGNLLRTDVYELHYQLDFHLSAITNLQSIFRGVVTRFAYTLMLEEFEEEEENIILLQARLRGYLVRKDYADRMEFFRKNLDKVIKIQSFVRAKRQGDAYKSLITGQNPPLSTVKSFVHLLADSDLDFEQEIILEQNRKRVIDEVRNNEMLEQFITQLDVKIALLLKNKITIDELVRHRNKGVKARLSVNSTNDMFDLKALNKTSRRRLELYQGFFYIIQTQPQYLARLFRKVRDRVLVEKEIKDVEGLVMNLYGYAQKSREEYFLLQLIGRSIQEEVENAENVKSFLRGNYIWWKLVAALNRGTKTRKSLRDVLGNAVAKVVDAEDLDLESDPLAIYRTSINNEELATGRLSYRSPNIPVDEAIQDPETRSVFINNLQNLRELSTIFLNDIEEHIDDISYHIRYLAKVIYDISKRQFGDVSGSMRESSKDRLLAVVGYVLFNQYLIPAIVASDSYGIVGNALSAQQTKNLNDVAKILSQIASLRPFSKDDVYLQPLNDHVKSCISRMKEFFKKVIYVQDLEQEFNTNIFDDLTSHQKPKLYLKTADIFSIHSLICQELDVVAPNEDDSLRDVIRQLGSLPNDASEILNIARFTEVKLDLNPSFCRVEDPEAEITSLFVATKRCMLYVLRVQTGANLLEILLSPVMMEHEEKYQAILKEEMVERGKRNIAYSENALGDLSKLTYRELKLLTLEKVIELESFGRISREDNYQGILNSIALDIKSKRNRQISREKEMEGMKQTLTHLSEKEAYLQTQLKTYNNYIEQAMSTLQTKKGKRKPLVLPFTKQYFHIRDLQRNGRVPKFGSYKYTASNLFEKGVLVELNGYSEKQYNQVTFTFSSDEVGVFNIEAAYGLIVLPGASSALTLDELLGQQYNNMQYISLFDDMVKMNTNLTLHFIFKKFYGDSQ